MAFTGAQKWLVRANEDGRTARLRDIDQPVSQQVPVTRFVAQAGAPADDVVGIESPLELQVSSGDGPPWVTITLRSPGHDVELALGLLVGEGILKSPEQLIGTEAAGDVVRVQLAPGSSLPVPRAAMTSACGACGKSSRETLFPTPVQPLASGPTVPASVIHRLPVSLRAAMPEFGATGGVHGAGLFDAHGTLLMAREDVGRHNAVDKVVGRAFLDGAVPLAARVLVVSGRAGFELAQKAVMAGIPLLVAVGAPSSLAIEVARGAGLTLVGFARDQRFVVYNGPDRIAPR